MPELGSCHPALRPSLLKDHTLGCVCVCVCVCVFLALIVSLGLYMLDSLVFFSMDAVSMAEINNSIEQKNAVNLFVHGKTTAVPLTEH